ncbi:MAG: hypothetical protein V4707_01250 [Pseudomonadota bacterium]
MRIVVAALAALSLAACAGTPVPNARPLNASQIAAIGPTQVALAESNAGVTKSWFYQDTSSAGAAYGLIGVLVTATMNAIINYGPGKRAQASADELATVMTPDELNASLAGAFRAQMPASAPADAVSVSDVVTVQKIIAPNAIDDALEVSVGYTLSEDASTLRVVVTTTYQNAQIPYQTPYTFEGSTPKSETTGPTYRNSFTYYSRQLQIPPLTPELRERLTASIRESNRDEAGNPPAEGSDAYKAMMKELEEAADERLTPAEIAIFLTREWTRNNGELLKAEIESAHAFAARYALLDMNSTFVPSLEGQDEVIETMADGRIVTRVGAGILAGSYVTTPGDATSFSTYGNTASMSEAATDRAEAIRSANRAAQRAR